MTKYKVKTGTLGGRIFLKEIEATTPEEVRAKIEEEGFVPIEVRSSGIPFLKRGTRIKNSELLVFNQGFLTLLKAGLQLVEVLETLKKSIRNQALSIVLERVLKDLRSGKSLSEALRVHPDIFPALYVSTVAAGERTGDLVPSVRGYIEFQKRIEAIRKKVVSAASYPLILAGASILVVGFLITYVVPSFAGVYMDSGAELPLGTRALMSLSIFMKGNILFFPPIVAALFFLFRYYSRTESGKVIFDRIKLFTPGIGDIYKGYAVSKFSRTMGMLLRSGVPLPEAMGMAKGVLDNSVMENKLETVVRNVKQGGSVSDAIAGIDFMPEITLRMFSAGERSASLQNMCEEIAEFHDQDVEHRVEILTNLLEPTLMIVMGLIIGAIVVLMYMPIFQLGARI